MPIKWYESHGYKNFGWIYINDLGHERTPDTAADFFARVSGVQPNRPPAVLEEGAALEVLEQLRGQTVDHSLTADGPGQAERGVERAAQREDRQAGQGGAHDQREGAARQGAGLPEWLAPGMAAGALADLGLRRIGGEAGGKAERIDAGPVACLELRRRRGPQVDAPPCSYDARNDRRKTQVVASSSSSAAATF